MVVGGFGVAAQNRRLWWGSNQGKARIRNNQPTSLSYGEVQMQTNKCILGQDTTKLDKG
jgi:hypothetical protein